MVNLQGKESTALKTIKQSLDDNLNIIASDSRLKTITDKIADSRYTLKLVGETGTLPISSKRPSLLYGNKLYIGGGDIQGNALVLIDTNAMKIIKQISLVANSSVGGTFNMVSDGTYWYIGTDTSRLIKGDLETGEVVLSQYNASFGSVYNLCVDNDYLYACGSGNKIRKINKSDLSIVATSSWNYTTPISLVCRDNYLYVGGTGSSANSNLQAIVKILKSDLSVVNTSVDVGGQIRDLIFKDDYIYSASTGGGVKKWLLSDLSLDSTIYQHSTIVRTLKYKLGDFWLGDNQGRTLRVDDNGQLLMTLSTEMSDNYVLEIDESNQILYRATAIDATVVKYQIIDNLQNNRSTTVTKTNDIKTLNVAGTWVDNVYTLNGMTVNCTTLNNDYLRRLTFTGTTTADIEFVIHDFNASKKLTASTNYILNGVKSTDSLSTVFVRLILSENADGTGATTTIEKVAGDFNVTTTTNLYYKISIIIKSGVPLTNFWYESIPILYPK